MCVCVYLERERRRSREGKQIRQNINNLSLEVRGMSVLWYPFHFPVDLTLFKIERASMYGTNRKNEESIGSIFCLSEKIMKNVIGS